MGIMKRAVEANTQGLRGRKIVALGASMSKFAIVVARDSKYYEHEMLKNQPIAVTPNNGSDFTAEDDGGVPCAGARQEDQTRVDAQAARSGSRRQGRCGESHGAWISVAQKWGLRILIESHSTRSEAAGDDLDGPDSREDVPRTGEAVKEIERTPPLTSTISSARPGTPGAHEFQTWRLLHARRNPTRASASEDTYNWTVKWT